MNFTNYLLKNKKKLNKKIFFHNNLTYSSLYKMINSASLKKHLNFKNSLIGICVDDPLKFIIYYLLILKTNNIAVILEKNLTAEKYYELINTFKLNFLITDNPKNFSSQQINSILKINFTNFLENNVNFYKGYSLPKNNKKEYKDVATVLFTSGSTGKKKGVMLTHSNLINNTKSILKKLPILKKDIVNLFLPHSYSFGLSVLNTHFKKGSKFFFHDSPFIGSIISELKKYKCSTFYGVPSTFEILINKTNFLKNKFPNLRFFAQAGGKLEKLYKKKLIKKFKNKLYVMYGATEAAPRLSIISPESLKKKIESIGKPLPGIKFKLIKQKNSSSYQLAVKGKNIMKGYLKNKSLTKKSFINKYYLTGDIAKKDSDGFYFIENRIDKTIKRFGYKININYLKKIIQNIEYINNFELKFDNNSLNLLVTLKSKFKNLVDESKIKEKLRENLTNYEIPDNIQLVDEIAKSFNKKN